MTTESKRVDVDSSHTPTTIFCLFARQFEISLVGIFDFAFLSENSFYSDWFAVEDVELVGFCFDGIEEGRPFPINRFPDGDTAVGIDGGH